jgi:hypothetical protein
MMKPRGRYFSGPSLVESRLRVRRMVTACLVGAALATCAISAQQASPKKPGQGGASAKQLKSLGKLAEPWPDDATRAKQRVEAQNRPLFQAADTLPFSLKADFKALNRDRDRASTKVYPGVLTFERDGQAVSVQVELRPRGVLRRQPRICDQVPIRIDFPKEERSKLDKTLFDGQKELKLVTHCRDERDYEQFVLREYLAYKAFNLITPRSLRARLARGTYLDSQTGKTLTTRYAFFLENEDDLARRSEARVAVLPRTKFADHDQETLVDMFVFEFLLGNTDYSLFGLHNVVILKTQANTLYPIPYDYDVSGLVNPPYAIPDRKLGIQTVRDRLYRGPCKAAADLEPSLAKFRANKAAILALFEKQADLTKQSVDDVKVFLEDFFSLIDSPGRVKRKLVDTCNKETA